MQGWFQKLLQSRVSVQREQEQKVTKTSSVNRTPPSSFSSSSLSSPSLSSMPTLSTPPQSHSALSSRLRLSRGYDVFVCHSSEDRDNEEAGRLVSFLESSPHQLRCFLRQRDECPGGAVSTELCQAVQNSHLWALLITPNFLLDDWCQYMMHQALAEGPMSNRIIPLLQNLSRSHYPQELKFYIYIDLSSNPERGYTLLKKTVLYYFEDLMKKEKNRVSTTASSSDDASAQKQSS